MGVAILSGVLASLDAKATLPSQDPKWESHTPGTLTPRGPEFQDDSLPSRFIACVSRQQSATRLESLSLAAHACGYAVEALVGKNVEAAQAADVVLLWCVCLNIAALMTDDMAIQLQASTSQWDPLRVLDV